ncbi:MAG: hypothetical protein LBJ03_01010 [Holosporales bacterium]|jgi:hypothetical protein|nr:hypothetical protein [Holosporales bacterium]
MGQYKWVFLPLQLTEKKDYFGKKPEMPSGLLANYDMLTESDSKYVYEIKKDVLFSGFKRYLHQLETIFDDTEYWINEHWDEFDKISETNDLEKFTEFVEKNANGVCPFIYGHSFASSYTLDIMVAAIKHG